MYLIQELSILRMFSIVENDLVSLEKTPPVVITRLMKSMLLYVIMLHHEVIDCISLLYALRLIQLSIRGQQLVL